MKKIVLSFIAFLSITISVYAQEFYFGFSPGEISPVYSKFGDKNFTTHMDVFHITGNFIFSVIFKNNLEFETGVMYYNYPYRIRGTVSSMGTFRLYLTTSGPAYHAFSLPAHIGYKFKLANRLYANVYSGLNFDFYFAPNNSEYIPYAYPNETYEGMWWNYIGNLSYWQENTLQKRFNIMFANRVSLQYFTKFNMGISLYASYYSGLRQVWEGIFHYTYDFGETINKNVYLSRGSYWNFGLELGFKISKDSKAQRKQTSTARKEQRKKIYDLLND
jgi:hypothetical protein